MAKRKGERNPPRFEIGETVSIGTTIYTKYRGLTGMILKVETSQHCHTLDRYVVQLTVEAEDTMPDDPNRRGAADRKRVSQQKHEKAYQARKKKAAKRKK
jgi:hypothetical protein